MGMLFQFGALFTDMSVYDNVAFPLRETTALNEHEVRERVMQKLTAVGLAEAAEKMPAEISGGMARRVASLSFPTSSSPPALKPSPE